MRKKIESILCTALAAALLCSCNAVTPGPVTTRSQGTSIVVEEPEETEPAAAEETETDVSSGESAAGESTAAEETAGTQAEENPAGTAAEEETGTGPETQTDAAPAAQAGDEAEPLPEAEEEEEEIPLGGEGTVYARSAVNVRDAPGTDSEVVGTLREGEAVKKLGEDGSWVMIEYNGTACYVYRDYLTEEP